MEDIHFNMGDVIFWNSRTIHGALPTLDRAFLRKSLREHYLPENLAFGNLFVTKDWITLSKSWLHKYFANQPEYSARSLILARAKSAMYNRPQLLRPARRLQRRSISETGANGRARPPKNGARRADNGA